MDPSQRPVFPTTAPASCRRAFRIDVVRLISLLYRSTIANGSLAGGYNIRNILTENRDPAAYWRKLKQRLKEEDNETVTNCHWLKVTSGKQHSFIHTWHFLTFLKNLWTI